MNYINNVKNILKTNTIETEMLKVVKPELVWVLGNFGLQQMFSFFPIWKRDWNQKIAIQLFYSHFHNHEMYLLVHVWTKAFVSNFMVVNWYSGVAIQCRNFTLCLTTNFGLKTKNQFHDKQTSGYNWWLAVGHRAVKFVFAILI